MPTHLWQKGESGNPKGRPTNAERERRARVKLQAALKALEKQHEPARQDLVSPEASEASP